MDRNIRIQGIDFQWDSDKAEINWQKHGISFQSACALFFDPFVMAFDDEIIDGEERFSAVGMTKNWQVLYVVYM